jgi:hypothetical protein
MFSGFHGGLEIIPFTDSCTTVPCHYGLSSRHFRKENFEFHMFTNQKAEFNIVRFPRMMEIHAKALVQSFRLEDGDGDGQVLLYVGSTKRCHHLTTETESLLCVCIKNPSIFEPVNSSRSIQASEAAVAQQWEKLIFHQNPDFGTVCD